MSEPVTEYSPSKVEYIEVLGQPDDAQRISISYTRVLLKSALQLAGCKTRVAHKVHKLNPRDA